MSVIRRLISCTILFVIFSQSVWASGFSILELGARASGMGGAFAAVADDGSALFYNPAGIAFQRGTRIQMDGFIVKGLFHQIPSSVPPGTIVPKDGYSGTVSPKIQFLGNMYMTKTLSPNLTFGFGMYAPFGLGDNWTNFQDGDPVNTKFPGRYAGTRGLLQNIWAQPTFAYKLTNNSSFAVGPALVFTHLLLEESLLNPLNDAVVFGNTLAPLLLPGQDPVTAGKSIARLLPEGRARFAGKAFSPGITLGYLFKHQASKTNFGVMWRSPVTFHVKGKASFAFTKGYPLEQFIGASTIPNLFPAQDIKASFTTPGTFSAGIANSKLWKTTFAFDFLYQNYNRFKDIPLNFSKTKDTATPAELRFNFDFKNTYFLRAGVERHISTGMIVRAGYYFDRSGVPDKSVTPFFPDSDKHVLTLGLSRQKGNKEFTLFYQGAFQKDRITNVAENNNLFTNGTYKVFIHLIGFGMRINRGAQTIDPNE